MGEAELQVTVYLGKGDHYFFTCGTGFSADLTGYSSGDITDFCTEIPTL